MSSQTSSQTSKRSRNSTPSTRRTWTGVDSNAKNMDTKKWPIFVDWEEIFGRDRATGDFAEGPLDVVEEIQRSQSSGLINNMRLGFLIDLDGDEEAGTSQRPNMTTGEAENATGPT
ncbi:hypothetical protein KY290_008049 [Solanum tuberosum]|uniref:Integrase core domain containing protein n=1 Tax=Solanum tuberosum TaxID=4113 RepID=A0ABQ7W955_SOLTU|nr:hypothetical protein KY290_008049 [Solanum tuberosum]